MEEFVQGQRPLLLWAGLGLEPRWSGTTIPLCCCPHGKRGREKPDSISWGSCEKWEKTLREGFRKRPPSPLSESTPGSGWPRPRSHGPPFLPSSLRCSPEPKQPHVPAVARHTLLCDSGKSATLGASCLPLSKCRPFPVRMTSSNTGKSPARSRGSRTPYRPSFPGLWATSRFDLFPILSSQNSHHHEKDLGPGVFHRRGSEHGRPPPWAVKGTLF